MNNTLLQIAFVGSGEIFAFLVALAISIGIFFLIRGILLWYWRVDELVANQKKQIELMQTIIDGLGGIYRQAENKRNPPESNS